MPNDRVVVIGAGIGGLACAIELAARGLPVTVVERAAQVGGKMREAEVAGTKIDCGPTVFTMRWVFDALFAAAGADFGRAVKLTPLEILARHAWSEGEIFDLFGDLPRAVDAVAAFAGPDEGRRFRQFCAEAEAVYRTLKVPFLESPRPNPLTLTGRIGFSRPGALFGIRPFETLWRALSQQFHDPRLRQLFGRYATYGGSSPFLCPATLMLIAHVERDGVWTIDGGMQRLADALEQLARSLGVTFELGAAAAEIIVTQGAASAVRLASGERLGAAAVVLNADPAALACGLFGTDAASAVDPVAPADRSLSAVTWAMVATTQGFPLLRHNVFFSGDYAAEFDDLFDRSRLPGMPTIYVCAQDRGGSDSVGTAAPERLLLLVNAPARGDSQPFDAEEITACETRILTSLRQCGLSLQHRPEATQITTPRDFHHLFPATGGALYGRASHGWMASFRRPTAQTRLPGLYLAGGSTHPGAGVPMAALSGQLAARRLLADRASTRLSRQVAISGGTLTG